MLLLKELSIFPDTINTLRNINIEIDRAIKIYSISSNSSSLLYRMIAEIQRIYFNGWFKMNYESNRIIRTGRGVNTVGLIYFRC